VTFAEDGTAALHAHRLRSFESQASDPAACPRDRIVDHVDDGRATGCARHG
jgi:hypothetical protein